VEIAGIAQTNLFSETQKWSKIHSDDSWLNRLLSCHYLEPIASTGQFIAVHVENLPSYIQNSNFWVITDGN
jgi:hypothetical protein